LLVIADGPDVSEYLVSVGKDPRYVYGSVISGAFKEITIFEHWMNSQMNT
jgi:hypothetical protein